MRSVKIPAAPRDFCQSVYRVDQNGIPGLPTCFEQRLVNHGVSDIDRGRVESSCRVDQGAPFTAERGLPGWRDPAFESA